MEKMSAALPNETDILRLSRLQRAGNPALQDLREAEYRIERRAQLVTHIRQELGFCQVSRLCRCLSVAQRALRQDLFGNIARGSPIAEKPPCFVKERVAADRDAAFRAVALARIDEVAERFVPVQHGKVLLPFCLITVDVRGKVDTGPTDTSFGNWADGASMVGKVGKAMLGVGFPEPVRRGQRKVPAARFALAQRSFRSFQRVGAGHQDSKQQSKSDNRAKRAEGDKN